MKIGKIGAWINTNALNKDQLTELVTGLENMSKGLTHCLFTIFFAKF